MKWSQYNFIFDSPKYGKLLYNSASGIFMKFNDSEDVEMLKNNHKFLEEIENGDFLKKVGIFTENDDDVVTKKRLEVLLHRMNKKALGLTIVPTQACNFKCNYCFETSRPNNYMDDETENNIMSFIKSFDVDNLDITWYGGEPLLAISRIVSLTDSIKNLEIKNYHAGIVTNGYLLDNNILDALIACNITSIQITLDGQQQTHDSRRMLLSGKGSFDRIMDNLKNIYSRNIENLSVAIRVNVDKTNEDDYINIYNFINQEFPEHKFYIYPAFVDDYGDNCKSTDCMADNITRGEFLTKLYHKYGLYNNQFYPRPTTNSCMARAINAFLIAPNGDLYKCWNVIGNSKMVVGNVKNKRISNTTLLARYLIGADYLNDSKCISCFYFPSCNGGCPYLRMLEHYENRKVNYCIVAKNNLPKFLEMHYEAKEKQQEKK